MSICTSPKYEGTTFSDDFEEWMASDRNITVPVIDELNEMGEIWNELNQNDQANSLFPESCIPEPTEILTIPTTETEEKIIPKQNYLLPTDPQIQYRYLMCQLNHLRLSEQKTIQKQNKTSKRQTNTGGDKLATKKNYSTDKTRTHLPKRCGDSFCSKHQYYPTSEEATLHIQSFDTLEKKSTYCPCGKTVQYYLDGKWWRSGNLSRYLKEKKNKKLE